jgi:hypothetical protein
MTTVKLKHRLKIIHYREKYLDLWESYLEFNKGPLTWNNLDSPRWKLILCETAHFVKFTTYLAIGPIQSINQRRTPSLFVRVKGISRTTTKTLKPLTKTLRRK